MTRKDYQLIANAINVQLKGCEDLDSLSAGLRLAAYALSEDLAEENPKFDKLIFERACFIGTKFYDGGKKIQARDEYLMS